MNELARLRCVEIEMPVPGTADVSAKRWFAPVFVRDDARREQRQVEIVPSVERQVVHLLRRDRGDDLRALRSRRAAPLPSRRSTHSCAPAVGSECRARRRSASRTFCCDDAKPGAAALNCVVADGAAESESVPARRSWCVLGLVAVEIADRHRCAGNRRAGRVLDRAVHARRGNGLLRVQRQRQQQKKNPSETEASRNHRAISSETRSPRSRETAGDAEAIRRASVEERQARATAVLRTGSSAHRCARSRDHVRGKDGGQKNRPMNADGRKQRGGGGDRAAHAARRCLRHAGLGRAFHRATRARLALAAARVPRAQRRSGCWRQQQRHDERSSDEAHGRDRSTQADQPSGFGVQRSSEIAHGLGERVAVEHRREKLRGRGREGGGCVALSRISPRRERGPG